MGRPGGRINGGQYVAWFAREGEPESLRFARGFEPDLARGLIDTSHSRSGLYGGAIAVNLVRGRRHVACGCLGPAAEQPLHAGLLVRNTLLVVAAVAAAMPVTARPLSGLDGFTVVVAVATLALLYLGADGLMAVARLEAREPSA